MPQTGPIIGFSVLPPRDLKRLILEQVACRREQVLMHADAALDHVYFPESGVVSVLAVYADGSVIEMATIGREGCTVSAGHVRRQKFFSAFFGANSRIAASRASSNRAWWPWRSSAASRRQGRWRLPIASEVIPCGPAMPPSSPPTIPSYLARPTSSRDLALRSRHNGRPWNVVDDDAPRVARGEMVARVVNQPSERFGDRDPRRLLPEEFNTHLGM